MDADELRLLMFMISEYFLFIIMIYFITVSYLYFYKVKNKYMLTKALSVDPIYLRYKEMDKAIDYRVSTLNPFYKTYVSKIILIKT